MAVNGLAAFSLALSWRLDLGCLIVAAGLRCVVITCDAVIPNSISAMFSWLLGIWGISSEIWWRHRIWRCFWYVALASHGFIIAPGTIYADWLHRCEHTYNRVVVALADVIGGSNRMRMPACCWIDFLICYGVSRVTRAAHGDTTAGGRFVGETIGIGYERVTRRGKLKWTLA